MRKGCRALSVLLPGAVCGLLATVSVWLLISRADRLPLLAAFALDEETLQYITQALSILRRAQIRPAWLLTLLAGSAAGAGVARVRIRTVRRLMWLMLFLVLSALCLWFTKVNGIRSGAVFSSLFPAVLELMWGE